MVHVNYARLERGISLWRRGAVSLDGEPGAYWVRSDADPARRYRVRLPWVRGGGCECADWVHRGNEAGQPCKHQWAAALASAQAWALRELGKGRELSELKGEVIVAMAREPETVAAAVLFTSRYEMLCMLEEGEL